MDQRAWPVEAVSTLAEDKDTYLTRPDLGRLLSEESLRELKRRYADAPRW